MFNNNEFLNTKKGYNFINFFSNEMQDYPLKDAYGFVGVFGSRDMGHDIDLLFYPSGDVSMGEFIKAHSNFFKSIKNKLIKESSDLIPFPMLALQDEVSYLSQRKNNEVLVHNLVFNNSEDLYDKMPFFKDVLDNSCDVILGDVNNLKKDQSNKLNYYFFTLANNMVHHSNYPSDLLSQKNKHICDYVNKYALDNQVFVGNPKTFEDNLDLFYRTLDALDYVVK